MIEKRHCMICGADIVECMGFVLARDYLANKIPPREICGKCIFKAEEKWNLANSTSPGTDLLGSMIPKQKRCASLQSPR